MKDVQGLRFEKPGQSGKILMDRIAGSSRLNEREAAMEQRFSRAPRVGDVRDMTVLSFGGEIWDRVIAGADLLALGRLWIGAIRESISMITDLQGAM